MGKGSKATGGRGVNEVLSDSPGDRGSTVTGELKKPKVSKPAKAKTVTVRFRQNRRFELHLRKARQVVEFGPHEVKEIPAEWLEDPGFVQAQKYFTVKGV